jgi:aminoglycoside phosphotransferase
MSQQSTTITPLEPPVDVPEIQRGNWLALSAGDPVVEYVTHALWDRSEQPTAWRLARLSNAAYVYQETSIQWAVVAKFYAVKAGSSAHEYATRERDCIRQVQELGAAHEEARAVEPLALWRGVLFLEHVPGLTLENIIAVRHSQPGRLIAALRLAARFLVRLHVHALLDDERADLESSVRYAHGVVEQLGKYGVLQDYPVTRAGLTRLIDRWAARPEMEGFVPSMTHGDATTTNFVFPRREGVVVIDWERLYAGDPASDLGRLMAEITHSINQHGGSVAEAEHFVEHMVDAYRHAAPRDWDGEAVVRRTRFYRASSTLRIARNGWVSRLDRTALVAQAMALLVD